MKPDPKLIDSMAMRYRHDFGLLDEQTKDSIRTTMTQLWEEVVGLGFYKPRHDLKWFKDRVGKRVFRTEATCQCPICKKIGEVGLVIADEFHAQYLFDCQNELNLRYFDNLLN